MLGSRVRFVDSVKGGDANAQIIGSEVLVEKNNQNPVMFLIGHEWTHRMQELAPTEYRSFREAVAREVQGEVDEILQVYRDKDVELDYEAALDEAVANYSGRMIEDGKVLDDFIERHRNDRTMLQKVLDSIRELVRKLTGAERSRAQTAAGKLEAALDASAQQAESLKGNKNTAQEGGEGRFAIKYDFDNRPFVSIESDILAGVPKSRWVDEVKETLAKKFPNGVRVGRNTIKINSQTRREMTYSEYTKWLARNDKSAYADKFRAADYVDEIILASRDYINEGLKHSRKDNIRDFARGGVLLRVGGTDYTADVVVGTTNSGEMLLYDIVNLQKTTIKERSRHTVQPNQMEGRRSGMPATENSVPQPAEKSKGKFSLKRATAAEVQSAEKMEHDGAAREDIWAELWVIRDAAGNWVSEIDDSRMKYHRNGGTRDFRISSAISPSSLKSASIR